MPIRPNIKGLAILLSFACLAFAQAQETDAPESPIIKAESLESRERFLPGDSQLGLSVGVVLPLFIYDPNTGLVTTGKMGVGGAFSVSLCTFLLPGFFLGGELSGIYTTTVAEMGLYALPLGCKAGWAMDLDPFEVAAWGVVGASWMRLSDMSKIDPAIKAGISAAYRPNADWSFGLEAEYLLIPQWYPSAPDKDRLGNFLAIRASMAYTF